MAPPESPSLVPYHSSWSSTSSSSSNTSPSGPRQEPEINHVQEEKGNKKNDGVIDLCSDEDRNGAADSDSEEESELKLVEELREVQKAVSLKLNKLERKVQKWKRIKEAQPKEKTDEGFNQVIGHQEPGGKTINAQLPFSASTSTCSRTFQEGEDERQELKRKLEMVTAELSKSRTEQVKKTRRTSTPPKQMVIEVPEFPMEYYNQLQHLITNGNPVDWYKRVNVFVEMKCKKLPNYRQWIQTRTSEFLPEVLKVMTTVWNKSTSTTSQLNAADLLNCRLVSKSWKRSVDKTIKEPYQQDIKTNENNVAVVSTKAVSTDFTKLWNLATDYSSMRESPRALIPHPFPSGSFIIRTCPLQEKRHTEMFSSSIQQFLKSHGKDLHHFSYHGHDDDATFNFFDGKAPFLSNTWKTLKGWLVNMPNLKSLQISLPPSADAEESSEHMSLIAQHSFPRFPKLVTLECRHVPRFLMESVLSHNKTIEKLDCFQLSGKPHPRWGEMKDKLSKLSEFSLSVSKMSHILFLGQVNWPLQKLTLSSWHPFEEVIDVGFLFTILKTFQETLQELELKMWITCFRKDLRLELPRLKKLDLYLMENSNEEKLSYDFLLPLNQLEMLKLAFEREENETDKMGKVVQVIQLHGYLNRLYYSNIWNLFPCLKKVEATEFYTDSCVKEFTYVRDKLKM